jgi:phage/plasmid-like protein (TIGR03299 family)
MSHHIAQVAGKDAIAYQGAMPWHTLGTQLDPSVKTDLPAVLAAASLANWNVELHKTYLADGRENPFNKAVVRTLDGQILAGVGPNTPVIQNERALGILEVLTKEFGATIETAGALYNGSRVWALAKFPGAVEVLDGDAVEGYMVVVHEHGNSHSLDGIGTDVRVVCHNTLTAAIAKTGSIKGDKGRIFKIKKTSNADSRIDDAAEIVKQYTAALQARGETYASFAKKQLTPRQVAEYIESVFPLPLKADGTEKDSVKITERRKTVAELVFNGVGAELAGSNARTGETNVWAVFNAITEYFDHVRPAEAQKDSAKHNANVSALFGSNAAAKVRALVTAKELVAAA